MGKVLLVRNRGKLVCNGAVIHPKTQPIELTRFILSSEIKSARADSRLPVSYHRALMFRTAMISLLNLKDFNARVTLRYLEEKEDGREARVVMPFPFQAELFCRLLQKQH